jgi:hypothetical protein
LITFNKSTMFAFTARKLLTFLNDNYCLQPCKLYTELYFSLILTTALPYAETVTNYYKISSRASWTVQQE